MYVVHPIQVNVFTEEESNVIISNDEMCKDTCRCIILRNFVDWMVDLKMCLRDAFFF